MSNGVFILETQGPEFRVAYSEQLESIYGEFNDINIGWDPNPEAIKSIFGNSKVFINENEALKLAYKIAENYPYLDNGIMSIDDFQHLEFSLFSNG